MPRGARAAPDPRPGKALMNVLFFAEQSPFLSRRVGGAENSMRLIAEGLAARGHRVAFASLRPDPLPFPRRFAVNGVACCSARTRAGRPFAGSPPGSASGRAARGRAPGPGWLSGCSGRRGRRPTSSISSTRWSSSPRRCARGRRRGRAWRSSCAWRGSAGPTRWSATAAIRPRASAASTRSTRSTTSRRARARSSRRRRPRSATRWRRARASSPTSASRSAGRRSPGAVRAPGPGSTSSSRPASPRRRSARTC